MVKVRRIERLTTIMPVSKHADNKQRLALLRAAMYDFSETGVCTELDNLCTDNTVFRLAHPFGDTMGSDAFYSMAYQPLLNAWPDLERRDHIVIAGTDTQGHDWVGCCGNYIGTFIKPWLDIPATGQLVQMRFHEFYRMIDGYIVEAQMLWDIPEVMQQANAWPMTPALGKDGPVPGPADSSGLHIGEISEQVSRTTQALIIDMINNMIRHPAEGGPELMQLEKYWHPKMNWYGPAGIGSMRGVSGFRHAHQIPFLNAMPDRGQNSDGTAHHFFAQNQYAAVTGWPNMSQTVSQDGWLGIAPSGQRITLRSLDFWRVENGLIRENWVLVDLLDMYKQIGVDVFARLREFNQSRLRLGTHPRSTI